MGHQKFRINMGTKYFEDLFEGERLNCQPVFMTRDAIIEFAKQFDQGNESIQLETFEGNKNAINFYQNNGWSVIKRQKDNGER
jgi:hypothetical protein